MNQEVSPTLTRTQGDACENECDKQPVLQCHDKDQGSFSSCVTFPVNSGIFFSFDTYFINVNV